MQTYLHLLNRRTRQSNVVFGLLIVKPFQRTSPVPLPWRTFGVVRDSKFGELLKETTNVAPNQRAQAIAQKRFVGAQAQVVDDLVIELTSLSSEEPNEAYEEKRNGKSFFFVFD